MPSVLSQIGTKTKTYVDAAIAALPDGSSVAEDTEANIRAETGSAILRNTDTGEFFAVISGEAYRLQADPLPTNWQALIGGTPTQSFASRITGDGGTLCVDGSTVYLRAMDGSLYQVTISAVDQGDRYDAESALDGKNILNLGSTHPYSILSGNSDAGDETPLAHNFQAALVGGSQLQVIFGCKGDKPPTGNRLFNHSQTRIRGFLGNISDFMAWAVEGEEGQNNVAASNILDANGDQLDADLTAGKRYFAIADAHRILDGNDRVFSVTSEDNTGTIRFTVSGKDLTGGLSVGDHIAINASDGSSVNGLHRITAISFSTDTTIDVATAHQTGDATTGHLRAMARLEQITSTAV